MAERDGLSGRTSSIWRWLDRVLCHLPTVLLLAAVSVILHHSDWYRKLELIGIPLVASASSINAPMWSLDHDPSVVAVVLDETFFETAYGRRLPLDRRVTAQIFMRIAAHRPRLIALDMDATPAGERQEDQDAAAELRQAVRAALQDGIDVVLTTYAQAEQVNATEQARSALRALCSLGEDTPGRLVVASPLIDQQAAGFGAVVARVQAPDHDSRRKFAQSVAELAQGAPALELGVCAPPQTGVRTPGKREILIRFIDDAPAITQYHGGSAQTFEHLRNKVVLIGARSFPGLDTVSTAVGPLAGVQVNAFIVSTLLGRTLMADRIKQVLSFGMDVVMGLLLALSLQRLGPITDWMRERGVPDLLQRAVLLVGPALLLGAFLVAALYASGFAFARGYWIDPVPIGFGLVLHVYAELIDDSRRDAVAADASGHHHGLSRWLAQTRDAWHSILVWRRRRPDRNQLTMAAWRLLMVGIVAKGVVGVLHAT